jgi:predicted outer membrane lipoprotein
LPCRVSRHLGLPFTCAFALVTPVKLDNFDDTASSKIRQ